MFKQGTAKYITRHSRDYIHVTDVCRAIAYLIPSRFVGPIDIGTGVSVSVMDIAKAMGRNLPIKEDTPGEPDSLCADTTDLTALGWFPTINIMDTLQDNESPELAASFQEGTEAPPYPPSTAPSTCQTQTVDKPSTQRSQTQRERL